MQAKSGSPSFEVARATAADIKAIVALTDAAQDRAGGGLAQRFSEEQIAAFIAGTPSVVAFARGELVGVLLTSELRQSGDSAPITKAMLAAYPGEADAYVYGPIAVAAYTRGMGVAAAMASELARLLPGREGILFINRRNKASLRAHEKLGAREVGAFKFGVDDFLVFSFKPGSRDAAS